MNKKHDYFTVSDYTYDERFKCRNETIDFIIENTTDDVTLDIDVDVLKFVKTNFGTGNMSKLDFEFVVG